MAPLKITGGARIGSANATWPFATLKVNRDTLELNASIIGNLIFLPQDIVSLEPYSSYISKGLKINHRVKSYKPEVIFWTFRDTDTLISQIKQIGFLENINRKATLSSQEILSLQESGSFPVKRSFAITFGILWNILFGWDIITFAMSGMKGIPLGTGAIIALSTVLFISILSLISKDFCRLIVKEGRTIKDISKFLYFIMSICVFILSMLLVVRSSVTGAIS